MLTLIPNVKKKVNKNNYDIIWNYDIINFYLFGDY